MIVSLLGLILFSLLSSSVCIGTKKSVSIFKTESYERVNNAVLDNDTATILDNFRLKYYEEFKSVINENHFSSITPEMCNMHKIIVITQCRAALKTVCNSVSIEVLHQWISFCGSYLM